MISIVLTILSLNYLWHIYDKRSNNAEGAVFCEAYETEIDQRLFRSHKHVKTVKATEADEISGAVHKVQAPRKYKYLRNRRNTLKID